MFTQMWSALIRLASTSVSSTMWRDASLCIASQLRRPRWEPWCGCTCCTTKVAGPVCKVDSVEAIWPAFVLICLQYKLCKVKKIIIGTKGIPHLVTHDARTIRYPDPLIKVNDTVRIDLESGKITDFIKFDTGAFLATPLPTCSPCADSCCSLQATCAWWPEALTWVVLAWSPTGSVTPAPLMWCTSRTARATASPPGCPTSLWSARWAYSGAGRGVWMVMSEEQWWPSAFEQVMKITSAIPLRSSELHTSICQISGSIPCCYLEEQSVTEQ